MSASAITNALYNMFSATSAFGPGNVSCCSYAILENAACAALFISWSGLNNDVETFQTGRKRNWDFQMRAFIRDTGDPEQVLGRVISYADIITTTFEADQTLQGSCTLVPRVTMSRNPELALSVNGATWLPFDVLLTAQEWN